MPVLATTTNHGDTPMTYQFPLHPEHRYDLAIYVYDEYKSVHGIRPRWMGLFDDGGISHAWSDADLIREADALEAEIREMNQLEMEWQTELVEQEQRERAAVKAAMEPAPAFTPFADLLA